MGGFFTGGAKAAPTFGKTEFNSIIKPLIDQLAPAVGQVDLSKMQGAMGTPVTGSQAMGNVWNQAMGFNPQSFFQGGLGTLGSAGGMFGQAQNMIGADPFGARQYFQSLFNPNYTNVGADPTIQAALGANRAKTQEFLNQNLDKIGAGSQLASGGVGQGSAQGGQQKEALARAGELLSQQNANTLLSELQRREGLQFAAGQQGIGEGQRMAQTLGQLGQGLGGIGAAQTGAAAQQGQLGLQNLNMLSGLGQYFQGLNQQQAGLPLDVIMSLGSLLKSGSAYRTPSIFDQIQMGGQLLGGLAGGAAGLMGGGR